MQNNSTDIPNAPIHEVPEESVAKPKKYIILFPTVILLIISATLNGVLFIQNQQLKNQVIQNSSTPTLPDVGQQTPDPTEDPTKVEVTDPATGWKIFNSERYEYSFSYPSEWVLYTFDEKRSLMGTNTLNNIPREEIKEYIIKNMNIDIYKLNKPYIQIEITLDDRTPTVLNLQEYTSNLSGTTDPKLENQPLAQIGNLKTIQVTHKNHPIHQYYTTFYSFPKNRSVMIDIYYSSPSKNFLFDSELGDIVHQILSTFKFIE